MKTRGNFGGNFGGNQFPPPYSWYLGEWDGHARLLIGPCGYGDGRRWVELGPVDLDALRRSETETWRAAILGYKVNDLDYRCQLELPFMGTDKL